MNKYDKELKEARYGASYSYSVSSWASRSALYSASDSASYSASASASDSASYSAKELEFQIEKVLEVLG